MEQKLASNRQALCPTGRLFRFCIMKEARKIACVAVNIGKHSETHKRLLSAAPGFVMLLPYSFKRLKSTVILTKYGEIKWELTSHFDKFLQFCYYQPSQRAGYT